MKRRVVLAAAALAASLGAGPAPAALITFDFDTIGTGANAVKTYMNGVLGTAGSSLTVSSVTNAGVLSNNAYTGDGYVVGPVVNGVVVPATLGSTNGGIAHALSTTSPDKYLFNSGADRITITFASAIYGISFDYEIFPDGTCPNPGSPTANLNKGCTSTSNANWPDFDLMAGTTAPLTLMFHTDGIVPVAPGYTHSTHSGIVANEPAPQFLGNSGPIFFASGVTTLQFVDWPQRIGIDNLVICTAACTPRQFNVPEPGSLALLGLGIAGLGAMRRRKQPGA
ncbi:MAG: PEP-CTERM sorting domain-containing protein [Casimicrobiaceae bacterium]